jgi:hypothetical protein
MNAFVAAMLGFVKKNQTISFTLQDEAELSESPIALVATATSGLPVSFSSSNPAVASVSGNTLTLLQAGTVTITATQAGNGQWNAATPVVQEITINAAALPEPVFDLSVNDLVYAGNDVYPKFTWANGDLYEEIRVYIRIRESYNESPEYLDILEQAYSSEPFLLAGDATEYTVAIDFYGDSASVYNFLFGEYREYMLYIFVVGVKDGVEAENSEYNFNYKAITAQEIRLLFNF